MDFVWSEARRSNGAGGRQAEKIVGSYVESDMYWCYGQAK